VRIEEMEATEVVGAEEQRRHPMHEPTEPVPPIVRGTFTEFGSRHVKGVAVVRLLVAIWLVILGAILCAFGHWGGAFLFVAAGLVGSLAYLVPRWKLALDAPRNVHTPR
jgi:hypothetical protein